MVCGGERGGGLRFAFPPYGCCIIESFCFFLQKEAFAFSCL
jgi:hypothetical protein